MCQPIGSRQVQFLTLGTLWAPGTMLFLLLRVPLLLLPQPLASPQPLLTITPLGSVAHKYWKGHLRAVVISAVLGGQTLGLSRSSLEGEGLGGDFG